MTHKELAGVKSVLFSILIAVSILSASLLVEAQSLPGQSLQGQSLQAQSEVRIREAVDDAVTVRVPRSTHPLARAVNEIGRVNSNVAMKRMVLVLKPSATQEEGLRKLIDTLHDKQSGNYHKWLSPEEYGAQFGPSDGDLEQVKGWLQRQGFRIDTVARGKQWIEFSGNSGQVERAFHTEMHHYAVGGEKHVANSQDIALPRALTPVVQGVLSLHNFSKKAALGKPIQVHRDPASGKLVPDFTLSNSNGTFHFLVPGDYKKIYNTEPLLDAGIDGTGVSIAIVARTDIFLSDVHIFRQMFGLPVNDPVVVMNGVDPGLTPDLLESDLDVEWSGATAPNATIKVVTSATSLTTDGVDLSTSYIIDNAVAPIMSTSYSACEPFIGTAGNAHFTSLYRQAAAEGITAFVSTGDNGSATCDPAGVWSAPAMEGPAVSGLASTPYTVSVGGTRFSENGLDGNYWLANNRPDLSSAVGYIPEQVWNESCDPTVDPNQCFGSGLYFSFAGGGGPSNCSTSTLSGNMITCLSGTPKPSWQAGIGVPNDGVRDVPDLALAAAQHDGYLVCDGGFCETTEDNGQTIILNADIVFGTSASTPAMAGIMALLEQQNGTYQGLANYSLYQLAAAENLAGCNSTKITNPNKVSDCVFYDVTAGDNGVPGVPGYKAGKGYDMGTGLGSVNAANLVNRWNSAKRLGSKTALTVGVKTVQHGQSVPLSVAVSPVAGTGAPSGDFTLVSDKFPPVFGGTVAQGKFSGGVHDLPGGTYNFKVHYAGDAMFSDSDSGEVPIRVTAEDTKTSASSWFLPDAGSWVEQGNVNLGGELALYVQIQGRSGVGVPTGKVQIELDNATRLGAFPLDSTGVAFVRVDQLPPNTGLLPGRHVFTVTYAGDQSFRSSTSAPIPVTVRKGQAQFRLGTPQDTVTVGTPVFLAITGSGESEFVSPTGTVYLSEKGKVLASVPLSMTGIQGQGFVQGTATLNLGVGMHSIVLSYSGDPLYESHLRGQTFMNFTVNRSTGAAANVTLVQSPGSVVIGGSVNYVMQVRPAKSGGVMPTGTVNLLMQIGESDAFILPNLVPVPLVNGNATFVTPWFGAGRYLMTAAYSGDANYSPADSRMIVTVVLPAKPTVSLTASPSGVGADARTSLTATIVGAPNNLNLNLPYGPVTFFDSVNGGVERAVGTVLSLAGTGQNTVAVLLVGLSPGTHVLRAEYLGGQPGGTEDWNAASSNVVTVQLP